jgi:hypothetical protein
VKDDELADIIVEIFDGVTVLDSSFGPIYVKHFHQLDTRKVLSRRKIYLSEAINRGLMSEEDSFNKLIEDEMWDLESEEEINKKKKFIENLKNSLPSIKLPSQRENHKKLIKAEELSLSKLSFERENLIGLTAEKYVDKKVNKEFFESLVFVDKEMTKSPFDDFDYSDSPRMAEVSNIEALFFKRMSDTNISTAVLSPFFSPYLAYSEDVMGMFGTPIKDLTAFQLKMITYARSFLNIFKNSQKEIPKHIAKDPELLIDFYDAQKNQTTSKKGQASEREGGTTYFGATSEDINQVKEQNQDAVVLEDEIKKKGGSLNMKQMMELHGL